MKKIFFYKKITTSIFRGGDEILPIYGGRVFCIPRTSERVLHIRRKLSTVFRQLSTVPRYRTAMLLQSFPHIWICLNDFCYLKSMRKRHFFEHFFDIVEIVIQPFKAGFKVFSADLQKLAGILPSCDLIFGEDACG